MKTRRWIFALFIFSTFSAAGLCRAATVNLVTNYGAIGDGNSANATINRNALIKALTNSANTVIIPAGTYEVDNSTMVAITGFSGNLQCDPNAVLVLTNSNNASGVPDRYGGLYFANGTGMTISNIHIVWNLPPGTLRDSLVYPALKIAYTTNATVNGAIVQGSLSAAIQFYASVNPTANNIYVLGALADGLDFFNDQNATAQNVYTNNTGDDGLAFVNYNNTTYANYTGGTASNITVLNSYARGISVVGDQNVAIRNFYVSTTTSDGILADYESATNGPTQLPNNVTFSNGTIVAAGMNGPQPPSVQTPNPIGGLKYGIGVQVSPPSMTTQTSTISLENIRVVNPSDRSVGAYMSTNLPNGKLNLTNIYVLGGQGYNIQIPNVNATNLVADTTANTGFYFSNANSVVAQNLYANNVSTVASSLHRALWLDAPVNSFTASNVNVVDTQSTPTGYIVGENKAVGSITGLSSDISAGTLHVQKVGTTTFTFPAPVSMTIAIPTIAGYQSMDSQPPTIPLSATTAQLTGPTTATIRWGSAVDNVGVVGYIVYRNGSQIAKVTDGTSYTDAGLSESTAYTYTVAAYDAANNSGAQSSGAKITTATLGDTTPPSVPQGVMIVGLSQNEVGLAWTAATDNVGVAGYHIFRNGVQIATATVPSFTDLNLVPATTYSYTVSAFDTAGNVSSQSIAIQATTPMATTQTGSLGGGSIAPPGSGNESTGSESSGSSSGGGNGGGGGTIPIIIPPSSGAGSSDALSALLQTLLAELQSLLTQLNQSLVVTFTRNLTIGSSGTDVQNLQIFLNDNGYTVTSSGAGSPGNESPYFGAKTAQALAAWQKANNLPATGYFGALTRQYMQAKW